MTPTRRRRTRVDKQVRVAIQDAALSQRPPSGTELHAELVARFPDTYPSLRTTQMLLNDYRPPEPGTYWSVGDGDPEDAALVLPVLAALYRDHHISTVSFSPIRADVARWIVRVRTIAPDMEPLDALAFASRFAAGERTGADTRLLTLALALDVWRSPKHEQRAIQDNLLPEDWAYVGPERRLP